MWTWQLGRDSAPRSGRYKNLFFLQQVLLLAGCPPFQLQIETFSQEIQSPKNYLSCFSQWTQRTSFLLHVKILCKKIHYVPGTIQPKIWPKYSALYVYLFTYSLFFTSGNKTKINQDTSPKCKVPKAYEDQSLEVEESPKFMLHVWSPFRLKRLWWVLLGLRSCGLILSSCAIRSWFYNIYKRSY